MGSWAFDIKGWKGRLNIRIDRSRSDHLICNPANSRSTIFVVMALSFHSFPTIDKSVFNQKPHKPPHSRNYPGVNMTSSNTSLDQQSSFHRNPLFHLSEKFVYMFGLKTSTKKSIIKCLLIKQRIIVKVEKTILPFASLRTF